MLADQVGGVYPRVCGGTTSASSAWIAEAGLSPRVRGNLDPRRGVPRRAGSIPACAGEPRVLASAEGAPRVYPRVCGGTVLGQRKRRGREGLSPRVRGNL